MARSRFSSVPMVFSFFGSATRCEFASLLEQSVSLGTPAVVVFADTASVRADMIPTGWPRSMLSPASKEATPTG